MAVTFSPHSLKSHSVDENARRRYVVRYKAETTAGEQAVSVRQQFDAQFPLGVTYFTYGNDVDTSAVRVRPFTVTPWRQGGEGNASRWWVDASFDTLGDRHCKDETFDGPPWTHPWRRQSQSVRVMTPVFRDRNDVELVNYSDEPYYPAPEIEQVQNTILLTGNLLSVPFFTWAEFLDRGGAVNESAIGPFAARTLRVVDLEWTEAFWGACQRYYQCRVSLAVKSETWDLEITQLAFRKKNAIGDYEDFGVVLPIPIDTSGHKKTTGSPISRTHEVHNRKDFSQIGFPMSLLTT